MLTQDQQKILNLGVSYGMKIILIQALTGKERESALCREKTIPANYTDQIIRKNIYLIVCLLRIWCC